MPSTIPTAATDRRLLSAVQVAKICGVTREYVYALVKRGALPPPVYRCEGSRPRWWQHELDAALDQIRRTQAVETEARSAKARTLGLASASKRRQLSAVAQS